MSSVESSISNWPWTKKLKTELLGSDWFSAFLAWGTRRGNITTLTRRPSFAMSRSSGLIRAVSPAIYRIFMRLIVADPWYCGTTFNPKSPARPLVFDKIRSSDNPALQQFHMRVRSIASLTELDLTLGLVRFHQGAPSNCGSRRNLSAILSSSLDQTFWWRTLHRTTGFFPAFYGALGSAWLRRDCLPARTLLRPGQC